MPERLIISQTKLIIPQRRRELLSRPRLLDMLSDLLDYRLIIIAAPAGYGKTTLLIDFASQFDWPICWYALDNLDQDLLRFINHFIHAIKVKFPDFGDEAIQMLENVSADQVNLDFIISTLTNDIYDHIDEHFVVVLDDYHLLNSTPKIDQFVSEFVQRVDESCHIVVTSRKLLTLPDLPLMVARSQVGGLSIEELAFQPDEVQKLLNEKFNQTIDYQQAVTMTERSEGWITGLLLTSQMIKPGLGEPLRIARVSGVGLYEYLAQQVLEHQPQQLRDFLLNTSLLEEFNPDMCQEVIGRALKEKQLWSELMDAAMHNNLFVLPVGEDGSWLRYHHLFRDFLQATVQKLHPDRTRLILMYLAEYHRKHQDWDQAFSIYHNLSDFEAEADLIVKVGSSLISKGQIMKLSGWISLLPAGIPEKNTDLLSLKASVEVTKGKIQDGCILLDRVVEMLRPRKDANSLADNLTRRSGARRMLGNYQLAMADAEEALIILGDDKSRSHLISEALRAKAIILYQQGNLRESLEYYNQAHQMSRQSGLEEDVARVLVEIGATYETLGDSAAAEDAYQRSLGYWQTVGDSVWQSTLLNNLGVLHHAMGQFTSGYRNLEKAMHYAQMTGNQRMEGYTLASIADLYRDLDAIEEALSAYQSALGIAQMIEDHYLVLYVKTALIRTHILAGNLSKAAMLLKSVQTRAKTSGSPFDINKCQLEQGALELSKGNFEKAVDALTAAGAYFSKEGYQEDAVRSELLLALCHYQTGKCSKAAEQLRIFISHLEYPPRSMPSLVSIHEMEGLLRTLQPEKEISDLISSLLGHLDRNKEHFQKSRQEIRSNATVLPFAPARIEVRTFGRIEVCVSKKVLTNSDWKTQTCRDLFLLFLAHPEGLTKEDVGVIFWPESSPSELKLRFKNTIYRMRHAIGTDVVIFKDNYYVFNQAVEHEYDVQLFLAAIQRAQQETSYEKKKQAYLSALDTYQGPYLPGLDAMWVIPERQKYIDMFIRTAQELGQISMEERDFETGIFCCTRGLEEDNCDEGLYRCLMQIYNEQGNKAAVSRQFQICSTMLKDEIGMEPSPQTRNLYNLLINS
jgi:LuxR family maltose regulon positive regulatory protein